VVAGSLHVRTQFADLAIQPEESKFLGDLQAALDLDDTREAEVAALVNEAVQA